MRRLKFDPLSTYDLDLLYRRAVPNSATYVCINPIKNIWLNYFYWWNIRASTVLYISGVIVLIKWKEMGKNMLNGIFPYTYKLHAKQCQPDSSSTPRVQCTHNMLMYEMLRFCKWKLCFPKYWHSLHNVNLNSISYDPTCNPHCGNLNENYKVTPETSSIKN